MVGRRDCQKVPFRRPFTGFAVRLSWPGTTHSRDSPRRAAARDPPSNTGSQPSRVSIRQHDAGRACRPAQVENQDPSDRSQGTE
jgi:hypothetical protein